MAAYTSTQDGPWSDVNTWGGGGTPGDGDTATVDHNVYIDGNTTVGTAAGATTSAITINNGGILRWPDAPGGSWTLTLKGRIYIDAGGLFQVGTEANPVPNAVTATVAWDGSHSYRNQNQGTLRVHGYPSYHMADSSSQRARLTANAAAGAGVAISLSVAVDWEVGDTIWIGTGGTPDNTPTGNEKTTIATKVDASNYTANLTSNHFGDAAGIGDVVVHATRNVIFQGTSGKGFSWRNSTGDTTFPVWDVNWMRVEYGGIGSATEYGAVFTFHSDQATSNISYPSSSIVFKNNVFEEMGVASSRCFTYYELLVDDPQYTYFSENHSYNFFGMVYIRYPAGIYKQGHLSVIALQGPALEVEESGEFPIHDIQGLWISGDGSSDCRVNVDEIGVVCCTDFVISNVDRGVWVVYGDAALRHAGYPVHLVDGEIYHVVGTSYETDAAIIINNFSYGGGVDFRIKNVKISSVVQTGMATRSCYGYLLVEDCTFDNCNSDTGLANSNYCGALTFLNLGSTTDLPKYIRFYNCEFGMTTRNKYQNMVTQGYNEVRYGESRIQFEKCKFKEPIAADPAAVPAYHNNTLKFIYGSQYDYANDWIYRYLVGNTCSLEFIDCEVYDSTGTDQWAIDYPNTTLVGIITGGAEIHKVDQALEPSGYIDGTFNSKFLMFSPTVRYNLTHFFPIKVPVTAGDTLTIKLSLKKTKSQDEYSRPAIHLEGCGIFEESIMSDVNNTWEELTVTGTALYSGVVEFFLSGRGIPQTTGPWAGTNDDTRWAIPYDPYGGNNQTIYADGLRITRS